MDFSLSETQQDIKTLAEKILSEQAGIDQQKSIEKQGERFDIGLWSILAEAGLLGVASDAELGGLGLSFTELNILFEEVGRYVAPVPVVPVLITALTLQQFAKTQHQDLLQAVTSGSALVTSALMDDSSENPLKTTTTAQLQNDQWMLNGKKLCVSVAQQAQAILVSAQTEDGLGVFLLNPQQAGVTLTVMQNTALEPQYEVVLDNVVLDAAQVITSDAQISEQLINYLTDRMTVAYCSMQTGLADKAMRMTASYTAEREQFGVPIATFQAVGHRAANCYIDVYCQRLVTQQAVSLLTNNQPANDAINIAKIWAGDCGHRVSYAAQHLHGGMGIDKDYPLWRYCIWMRHIELVLGSSTKHLAALGRSLTN